MKFYLKILFIAIVFVLPSSASEPDVRTQIMADLTDTLKIIDRPDIVKPYFDECLRDTIYKLNLPLVSLKKEKLKSKLSALISEDFEDIDAQFLVYNKKYKDYTLIPLIPCCGLRGIDEWSIGYCQIDSTYVIIDESAKSCVKQIKGFDKEFILRFYIECGPFNFDPPRFRID